MTRFWGGEGEFQTLHLSSLNVLLDDLCMTPVISDSSSLSGITRNPRLFRVFPSQIWNQLLKRELASVSERGVLIAMVWPLN